MVSASQVVTSIVTAKSLIDLGHLSQSEFVADTSPTPADPSVILDLSSTSTTPLTYNAKGLLAARTGDTPQNAGDSTPGVVVTGGRSVDTTPVLRLPNTNANLGDTILGVESSRDTVEQLPGILEDNKVQNLLSLVATANGNLSSSLASTDNTIVETSLTKPSTPPRATEPSTSVTTTSTAAATTSTSEPAVQAVATPTVPPVISAVTEDMGSTSSGTTLLATREVVDPAVQAFSDLMANPVYAGMATSLYVNAAIYRSQQVSSATLVKATDLPRPVSSVSADNIGMTDRNQKPTEDRRHGPASAR
jgi:hypothetical protein